MIIAVCFVGWIVIAGSPFKNAGDWIAMIVVIFVILALIQKNPIKSISENFGTQESIGNNSSNNSSSQFSNYINLVDKIVSSANRRNAMTPNTGNIRNTMNVFSMLDNSASDGHDQQPPALDKDAKDLLITIPAVVSDTMTLFTSSSLAPKNRIWTNMVSRTTQNQYCSMDGAVQGSNLVFSRDPVNEEAKHRPPAYFLGKGTSIEGPPSHKLGLDGNRNMTIFFVARMLLPSTGSVQAFQVFANTSNNNGIRMMFMPAPNVVGIQIGSTSVIEGVPPDGKGVGAPKESLSHDWFVDESHMHLWVLSKTQTSVSVVSFDLDTRRAPKPRTYIKKTISIDEPMILSNLPFQINKDLEWEARLMAFGMLPKALEPLDMQNLALAFKEKLESSDPAVKAYKQKIKDLGTQIEALKACPYNEKVCTICGDSVHVDIASSTPECMRAVAEFCEANPSHPRCTCWNSKSPQCYAYKQFLRQGGKQQPCKQQPCKQAPAPPPPPAPPSPPAAPAPPPSSPPPTCDKPRRKKCRHRHSHSHSHKKCNKK